MDSSVLSNIVLPIVIVCAIVALIWLLIETVMTVRKTRNTVEELQKQLTPTLDHVEQLTNDLQPAIKKVDPLVDRISLTVDAANLELMRVDQILEDVGDVTDSVSGATDAISNAASAPAKLVESVSGKVHSLIGGKHASEESQLLAARQNEKERSARSSREASHPREQSHVTKEDAVKDVSAQLKSVISSVKPTEDAPHTTEDSHTPAHSDASYYTYRNDSDAASSHPAPQDSVFNHAQMKPRHASGSSHADGSIYATRRYADHQHTTDIKDNSEDRSAE